MTHSIYLLGAPGVGKSSVMKVLLNPWEIGPYIRFTDREMFGHILYQPQLELGGAYLGHLRPEFPGTDALSMSVQPQAIKWLQQSDGGPDYIYGEGARLGNQAFLTELSRRSRLTVVLLTADPHVLDLRLLGRPDSADHKTGRKDRSQDYKWQVGQATRARNTYNSLLPLYHESPSLTLLSIDTTELNPTQVALSILGVFDDCF